MIMLIHYVACFALGFTISCFIFLTHYDYMHDRLRKEYDTSLKNMAQHYQQSLDAIIRIFKSVCKK